MHNLSSFS